MEEFSEALENSDFFAGHNCAGDGILLCRDAAGLNSFLCRRVGFRVSNEGRAVGWRESVNDTEQLFVLGMRRHISHVEGLVASVWF